MRTTILIGDKLMAQALRASGQKTKRAVVEQALRLLIQTNRQSGIRRLRGNISWQGDLDQMRESRISNNKSDDS